MDLLQEYEAAVTLPALKGMFQHESEDMTRLNRAYARMLCEQGLLTREDWEKIDKGLLQVQATLTEQDLDPHKIDLYFNHEAALYDAIGMDTACKLHVGRSRNDISYTLFRVGLRTAIQRVMEELLETQKVLERKIEENLETVIPYYTYGQPAQPGTWGHYLLNIHDCFQRDLKRLQAAYENVNVCPMGAAAGIGSSFPLNKDRMAQLLGFDGVYKNTLGANGVVDHVIETEAALEIVNTTLNKVSSDLMFFSSSECNILNCDMSICSGSSIMPQKKNPGTVMHLRAKTSHFTGHFVSTLISGGSVTMFPMGDSFAYTNTFWENIDILTANLLTLRLVLERSEIRQDVALECNRAGFTAAAAMAEILAVETGEPFVKVHHVVRDMVHTLMAEDRLELQNMTAQLLREASIKNLGYPIELTDERVAQMLDPLSSLNAKVTGGTPRPKDTEEMLAAAIQVRETQEQWLEKAKKQVADAYTQLDLPL